MKSIKSYVSAAMHRAWKIFLTKNETRIFLFVLISACVLVGSSLGVGSAQAAFDFGVSLNGYSISLVPNHPGYVEILVSLVSGTPQNVTLTSTVSPQDGELSVAFAQSWGFPSFVTTLIVSALNVQPGKQYQIRVSGTSQGLTRRAPALTVTISCTEGTCSQPSPTLTTAIVGEGSVNPLCPSGCLESVGHVLNVTARPGASWMFSGWNVTGISCSNGLNINPCVFTMPNVSVSITANFIQYQTLYTSYTGYGQLTPSCPSGCQIAVGSSVSIVADTSPGWQVSGYHLTSGVSCGSGAGYVCSFKMPNFPVSFQVTFTETTTNVQTTIVSTSTIKTSVTSTMAVASAATSTVSVTTTAVTAMGTTETTTIFSTSSGSVTQAQTNLVSQISNVTTNATAVTTALENPALELALASILLLSLMMIGINLVRRSGHRGSVLCSHCGFNNTYARKYCTNCGEPLKGT